MRPAIAVASVDSLGEAHRIMRDDGVRHLAVVRDRELIGVLSERDILEFRSALGFGEAWRDHGVTAAMTWSPRTASPGQAITDVAARLAVGKIGALPVVDDSGLVGIVTVADVLAADGVSGDARPVRGAITAADGMTPGPFTTRPDESLLDATRRMCVHGVRHLPVVDEKGHVIGMLSERDVRTAVGDPDEFARRGVRTGIEVRDAMTPTPITVAEDRPMLEIARMFEDGRIGAVPVIDRSQRIVGIVSYVDALHSLAAGGRLQA